jgi:putative endonuclease
VSYSGSTEVSNPAARERLGDSIAEQFMYYVYILKSEKDNKLYIGYSSNLKARLGDHTEGLVEATKNRRPLKLIYYESYENKIAAQERERKLKQFGSAYKGLLKRLKLE